MVQKELKLASFNVRGLTEDQKKVELAKDLKEKKVDIYAVVTVQKAAEEVVGYVQKMGNGASLPTTKIPSPEDQTSTETREHPVSKEEKAIDRAQDGTKEKTPERK